MALMKRMLNVLAVVLLSILIVGCGEETMVSSKGSELTLSNGWKIHYIDQGPKDAPVVLFVHGLGGSSEYWKQTLACPEMKKYRCLAIDMLGFGWSHKPKDFDYSMEKHAEKIGEFLSLKKVNKVVYVGHSLGGSIGIALAQLHAGLVEKLVLVDSTLGAEYITNKTFSKLPGWGELKFRIIFPFLKLRAKKFTSAFFENPTPEIINMASRAMKQSTYYSFHRSIKGLFLSYKKQCLLEVFKGFPIPHYYIYGTTDAGVSRMVKENFGSEPWVFAIEKTKHCPMVEDHELFCSILAGIVEK